jgi:hypothetical protein
MNTRQILRLEAITTLLSIGDDGLDELGEKGIEELIGIWINKLARIKHHAVIHIMNEMKSHLSHDDSDDSDDRIPALIKLDCKIREWRYRLHNISRAFWQDYRPYIEEIVDHDESSTEEEIDIEIRAA